jgi:hypothetical protein
MIRTSDRSIRVPAQPRSAELNPRGPTFGTGSSTCSTVLRARFWARRLRRPGSDLLAVLAAPLGRRRTWPKDGIGCRRFAVSILRALGPEPCRGIGRQALGRARRLPCLAHQGQSPLCDGVGQPHPRSPQLGQHCARTGYSSVPLCREHQAQGAQRRQPKRPCAAPSGKVVQHNCAPRVC